MTYSCFLLILIWIGVLLRDGERNKEGLLVVEAVADTGAWRVSVEVELAVELDLCEGTRKVAAGVVPDDAALSLIVPMVQSSRACVKRG